LLETQSPHKAVEQQKRALYEIVHATGLAVFVEGKTLRVGATPSQAQIYHIIQKIPAELSVFHTKKLKNLLPESEAYADIASGLLFINFADSLKMLWFKPEVDLSKTWAGNPEKPYVFSEDGFKINPRQSFESYQKQVRHTSEAWTATEMASANYFLENFEKSYLKLLYRQLTISKEHLEVKNKKLVELSAMMAHDIKNPLTSFNLLVELYESRESERDTKFLMKKLKDISQQLLFTSNELSNLSGILGSDIEKSMECLFLDVFQATLAKLEGQIIKASVEFITTFNIEVIQYPPAYLESIMLNLISNAIKYRSLERKLIIKITTSEKEGYVCLSVGDNGKGIDLAAQGKHIFGLYKTFHDHPEARGIGLYITKSQVNSMGGKITAESIPDKGTVFHVYLKKIETNA
jgi:light-regulated signal transduction histidine kinase (bacteriophytochrome)